MNREYRYYMMNKPAGYVTACSDICEKTVLDLMSEKDRLDIFPVGRLDKDTEGLLLLTDDGMFCNNVMKPENKVPKTYYFQAFGKLDAARLDEFEDGIDIGRDRTLIKKGHVDLDVCGKYSQYCGLLLGEIFSNVNKMPDQEITTGRITIMDGCKHQVKRMLKAKGCFVTYLKRESIGDIILDENLLTGQYKKINMRNGGKYENTSYGRLASGQEY